MTRARAAIVVTSFITGNQAGDNYFHNIADIAINMRMIQDTEARHVMVEQAVHRRLEPMHVRHEVVHRMLEPKQVRLEAMHVRQEAMDMTLKAIHLMCSPMHKTQQLVI